MLKFVGEFFELGEFPQHRKDRVLIAGPRVADDERIAHTATGALMCGCA